AELHDRAEAERAHFDIWTPPNAPFFSDELLASAEKHFDEAEKAVSGDAALLRRVQVARLPIRYVKLMKLGTSLSSPDAPAERRDEARKIMAEFETVAAREGITMVSEGQPFAGWRDAVRKVVGN